VKTVLVWFRADLRLQDNPALKAAAEAGAVAPVFVWSPEEEGAWAPGGASRWWLHHSLAALDADLRARGLALTVAAGPAARVIAELAQAVGADAVHFARRVEPEAAAQEERVAAALAEAGVAARAFDANLLYDPDAVRGREGKPYRVFTPFWTRCGELAPPAPPCGAPGELRRAPRQAKSLTLEALELRPRIRWDAGLEEAFVPGEAGARAALKRFLGGGLEGYRDSRDRPSAPGTSRLSPHLHFGELSVNRAWSEALRRGQAPGQKGGFLSELGWREFAHHVLRHQPRTPEQPLDPRFADFGWREDAAGLRAWRRGRTGFPIVDAGMRELWRTGWMHNRVRMIVASFLCKDLLVDWREGARWFWDTLVDADLANNTLGWQWTAGCGADAAPFFRVFNPVQQGGRWDAEGAYVRRWVPELARLPERWLHEPWAAPAEVLSAAGVQLGRDYPRPILDHAQARLRALAAFSKRDPRAATGAGGLP